MGIGGWSCLGLYLYDTWVACNIWGLSNPMVYVCIMLSTDDGGWWENIARVLNVTCMTAYYWSSWINKEMMIWVKIS